MQELYQHVAKHARIVQTCKHTYVQYERTELCEIAGVHTSSIYTCIHVHLCMCLYNIIVIFALDNLMNMHENRC